MPKNSGEQGILGNDSILQGWDLKTILVCGHPPLPKKIHGCLHKYYGTNMWIFLKKQTQAEVKSPHRSRKLRVFNS